MVEESFGGEVKLDVTKKGARNRMPKKYHPKECPHSGCVFSSPHSGTLSKHLKRHCNYPGCTALVEPNDLVDHYATEHPLEPRAHTGLKYSRKSVYRKNGTLKNEGWPEPNAWPKERTEEETERNKAFMNALKAKGQTFGPAGSPTGPRTRRASFFESDGGRRRSTRKRRN